MPGTRLEHEITTTTCLCSHPCDSPHRTYFQSCLLDFTKEVETLDPKFLDCVKGGDPLSVKVSLILNSPTQT